MAKSSNKILYIAGGLFFAAAIGGTIYYFAKKKKEKSAEPAEENMLDEGDNANEKGDSKKEFPKFLPPSKSGNPYLPPKSGNSYLPAPSGQSKRKDEFPIGKGSSGERVKLIQQALLKAYGKGILPKFGADGYWGKELESALQSRKISFPISESAYNSFFHSGGSSNATISDPSGLAKNLRLAIYSKNKEKTLIELRKIKTVSDYTAVNEIFKNAPLGVVRYTLVNAALSFFPSKDKESFRVEFLRMGLKYNPNKNLWSLSGIKPMVLTHRDTIFTTADGNSFRVPAGFRIGHLVGQEDGTAEILTADGKRLFASSATLKTLNK